METLYFIFFQVFQQTMIEHRTAQWFRELFVLTVEKIHSLVKNFICLYTQQ